MSEQRLVVLIAGAGRGIGRATSRHLASKGNDVALMARTAAELREAAETVPQALLIPGDASRPEFVASAVQQTLDRFGRIDALVNCAGVAPVVSIEKLTNEIWREIVDTNLSSVVYFARAVWPGFKAQKHGVMVNISSMASKDPFAGLGAYGAAKAGINLLGLALAREGAEFNIRVHTLALGAVETQMLRKIVSEKNFPKERTMEPMEVARVIANCIDGDLRYTSGEVIFLHKT
jgi:NAD(P)-dependent dehydrogenase (short-subunit alcohol dehydrogenase family)